MITAELVHACYAAFLGRAPESDAVVAEKMGLGSYEALLREFLDAPEHLARFPQRLGGQLGDLPRRIDVDVTPEALAAMFERVRAGWSALGEEDPYWSVLTQDAYRGGTLDDAARSAFYASGAEAADLLDAFAARAATALPRGVCLELGCGVGRVTVHLARRFERVIGVDVSPRNLDLCRAALAREGLTNVELRLLRAPQDTAALPDHDVLFSTLVLQHNPPPVQAFLLDALLARLRPGGAALVQVPTHTPDYAFDAASYLASPPQRMEMHCLPMSRVLDLIAGHGLALREVLMDGWTGLYGSHTFFATRAL